jgi:hypothetical protein
MDPSPWETSVNPIKTAPVTMKVNACFLPFGMLQANTCASTLTRTRLNQSLPLQRALALGQRLILITTTNRGDNLLVHSSY